jgi:hypothetical protein
MIFASAEYRAGAVQELYQQVLGRGSDAGGLQFFTELLGRRGGSEEALVMLAASEEYFARL